jgi:hypothetical protein
MCKILLHIFIVVKLPLRRLSTIQISLHRDDIR